MNDENAYYSVNRGLAATVAPQSPPSPTAASSANKGALSFILSSSSSSSSDSEFQAAVVPTPLVKRKRVRAAVASATRQASRSNPKFASSSLASSKPENALNDEVTQLKKGSKFCVVDGCMSRAKHAKRCWRHGGSVKCKVADCDNRAKSKGVCWSHGGGTLCSFERCDTISVSNGFCWAHGGGKRCVVSQCSKPAYERTQNYCTTHFEERTSVRAEQ